MVLTLRFLSLLCLSLAAGCGGKDDDDDGGSDASPEGATEGDCVDGADNDGDGLFDCNDDGCASAPPCQGGSDGSDGGDGTDGADGSSDGGDGTEEVPPPVAILGDVGLKCGDGSVTLDGSASYSPSDDHRVTGWEFRPGPTDTDSSTYEFSARSYGGDEDEFTLTVIDDLGQRSESVSTTVVTNTHPRLAGFQVSGDCYAYDTDEDDHDWLLFRWNEDCNRSRCSCQVTVQSDDPDDNQTHTWDDTASGSGRPDITVSGATMTWSFPSDFNVYDDWRYYCLYYDDRVYVTVSDPCSPDGGHEVRIDPTCIYGTY